MSVGTVAKLESYGDGHLCIRGVFVAKATPSGIRRRRRMHPSLPRPPGRHMRLQRPRSLLQASDLGRRPPPRRPRHLAHLALRLLGTCLRIATLPQLCSGQVKCNPNTCDPNKSLYFFSAGRSCPFHNPRWHDGHKKRRFRSEPRARMA